MFPPNLSMHPLPQVVPIQDNDDAVIHLRMGVGLYSTVGNNEGKGVFPHYTYINLLEQAMQEKGHLFKIGIVTAPFKGDKLRVLPDKAYTSLSELIVTHLIAAIKHEFPEAEVRLHNSPQSSIIESLARIVQARKVAILLPSALTLCSQERTLGSCISQLEARMYGFTMLPYPIRISVFLKLLCSMGLSLATINIGYTNKILLSEILASFKAPSSGSRIR
jgi:hypothetical protein